MIKNRPPMKAIYKATYKRTFKGALHMRTALRALKAIYQWPIKCRCVIMKKIYYFTQ